MRLVQYGVGVGYWISSLVCHRDCNKDKW